MLPYILPVIILAVILAAAWYHVSGRNINDHFTIEDAVKIPPHKQAHVCVHRTGAFDLAVVIRRARRAGYRLANKPETEKVRLDLLSSGRYPEPFMLLGQNECGEAVLYSSSNDDLTTAEIDKIPKFVILLRIESELVANQEPVAA